MMPTPHASFKAMTLFTDAGERKYLSSEERQRFLKALSVLEHPSERSFCLMIYWTGCRPSEALALTALNIDLEEKRVVIRSLKKRGNLKGRHFRSVPLPAAFVHHLNQIHALQAVQGKPDGGAAIKLWAFGRTKGWRLMRQVMQSAEIYGTRGCGRGLRHAYGVHAALSKVPESSIKKWLGHESLATTEIYLNMAGPEDRQIAKRMWR